MGSKLAEDPEIPDTGAVFTFGKSKFADNAPSKFWIKKDEIVLIACGDEHTAVVTQTGRLFTFGSNEWGQLGLGHTNSIVRPSCVKVLKPIRVTAVACGRHHTVLALESGAVMTVGSNSEGQLGVGREPEWTSTPVKVTGIEGIVAKLSAGTNHTACLTTDGSVFVWGSNTEGQLGMGEEAEENIYTPCKLELDFNATDISCGYYHTALVNQAGEVYCWGEAEGGKLGLDGSAGDTDFPRRVSLPERAVAVSCGGTHTIALTQSGRLYSWGHSSHGQLGLGTRILESSTPHPITSLSHIQIASISTGENHSVCISSSGHLYTWGDGRHGKLCLDTDTMTNLFSPAYVARFKGLKVSKAICGGCHTMVLGIPGGEEFLDEDELRINGSINEEVNLEARERRRSNNTREEIKAPLPPIKVSPIKTKETMEVPQEDPKMDNVDDIGDADDLNIRDEEDDDDDENENDDDKDDDDGDNKNEKVETSEEGKISKFFNGLIKKKKIDEKEQEKSEEDIPNGHQNIDTTDSDEKIQEQKSLKKVSFFGRFRKDREDKQDDETDGAAGTKTLFTKGRLKDEENAVNGAEKDGESDLSLEDAEEDKKSDTGADSPTSPVKPKPRMSQKQKAPEPANGSSSTSPPNPTGTVRSKSCSIL